MVKHSATVAAAERSGLGYLTGFGNEHASEALSGALPVGQNSPQRPPLGLYAEIISGTAFTAPRAENLRTWMYRIYPSAMHPELVPVKGDPACVIPTSLPPTPPNRYRWSPFPIPSTPTDFIDGLTTIATTGDIAAQAGTTVYVYGANVSMERRVFTSYDGELLLVPQAGDLRVTTELGVLDVTPGEMCVIPRGLKFRVSLHGASARGYVCENHGRAFQLPELGPIGSNGLANPRDFLAPLAAYDENCDRPVELLVRFLGRVWQTELAHSPFDVVAWHGSYFPYKYDLARFMVINTVSFDHADPSIYTVLTSPSDRAGTANVDFVIFPPRWLVAEHTFRPPWFHRNIMSEFMGLVRGVYDSKAEGFAPGGCSLHNCMSAHGPDVTTHERASQAQLQPHFLSDTLAFMFESRTAFRPTQFALESAQRQRDYDACWNGFERRFG